MSSSLLCHRHCFIIISVSSSSCCQSGLYHLTRLRHVHWSSRSPHWSHVFRVTWSSWHLTGFTCVMWLSRLSHLTSLTCVMWLSHLSHLTGLTCIMWLSRLSHATWLTRDVPSGHPVAVTVSSPHHCHHFIVISSALSHWHVHMLISSSRRYTLSCLGIPGCPLSNASWLGLRVVSIYAMS